ncbi:MAG: hypothetical protein CMJ88_10730 [Planctomycetes bacterium]|nr:hypothetical protein [Planctomycetota bacterium]
MTDEVASSEASPRELDGEVHRLRQHSEQLEADVCDMSRELRDLREDLEQSEARLRASERELGETRDKLRSLRASLSFEIGQIIGRGVKRPSVDTLLMVPRIARRLLGGGARNKSASGEDASGEYLGAQMLAPNPIERRAGVPLVGAVMDTFTSSCLGGDCDLLKPRPDNWRSAFERQRPDVLFVESAWHGNDDAWQYRVASYASPPDRHSLPEMLKWCRREGVPTVFWNKEDPVHFQRFISSARRFDAVLTTDADCIPRYQRATGHQQVFAMPFAAQPQLHNPTCEGERLNRVCFAGSYYADRHDARRVDMSSILEPALDFPFDIFDRNYGAVGAGGEKTTFPERFQSAIRGRLEYDEMVRAYKRYRVYLNVNSVKESPTMFSRRVFELLACGTPVVSSYSRGIVELLGDDAVMIAETADETRAHLARLLGDEDAWARLSATGLCRVHAAHTYLDRLADAWGSLHLPLPPAWRAARSPAITAVASCGDDAQVDAIAEQLSRQRALACVLIVGDAPIGAHALERLAGRVAGADVVLATTDDFAEKLAAQASDAWAVFDPSAHYGSAYLDDAVAALRYAQRPLLGRAAHFTIDGSGQHTLRRSDDEHRLVAEIPAASLVVRAGALAPERLLAATREAAFSADAASIQSLHRFNFATARPQDPAAVDLDWRRR